MPAAHLPPIIDLENPLYCPEIPAQSFLNDVRDRIRNGQARSNIPPRKDRHYKRPVDPKAVVVSFSLMLGRALQDGRNSPSNDGPEYDFQPFDNADSSSDSSDSSLSSSDPDTSALALPVHKQASRSTRALVHTRLRRPKRKASFDLPNRPIKIAKSISIVTDATEDDAIYSPLDLSALYYDIDASPPLNKPRVVALSSENRLKAKIRTLEDFLYGPPIGTESPRGLAALYDRLDKILPGIRIKRRLSALPTQTHQAVADFLGDQGFLNPRVMTMLRTSEIRALSMTESMDEESGLNIGSRDIIKVFNEPNSFTFLTYLSFSGCRVLDMDIMYIQHLPKLAILLLNNTGISNEAVYNLTSLKRTLTHLNLATNPHIDNDAIPALLILKKLSFFSILDTGVDVVGLRRLARAIHDEERIVDVEIPDEGERYLNCMHAKYLVRIQPPLISRPGMCAQASAAALKRNLQAHAEVNPAILAAGTKAEMRDRLEGILKTREADLVLYEMVLGSVKEEDDDDDDEGEEEGETD